MHCTQCATVLGATDKFCAKCGHPAGRHGHTKPPAAPSGNAESAKIHLEWLTDLRGKARRRVTILTVLVVSAVLGWAGHEWLKPGGSLSEGGGILLVGSVVGYIFYMNLKFSLGSWGLHAEDYYGLPGARTAAGQHRCVHCGHNNYYVKGEYGNSRRHHSCPRCNNYLFTTLD